MSSLYKVCLSLIIVYVILTRENSAALNRDNFYAIAHMVNDRQQVKWAMNAGANGVELDLLIDHSTGIPTQFSHGFPCDCTCIQWQLIDSVCHRSPYPCTGGKYKHSESKGAYNVYPE